MVSSLAVLFGAPRSNGAMVAPQVTNLEPHEFIRGSSQLFPDGIDKIARLGFGLASNHVFLDGNKRIGVLATQLLLKWNGYNLVLRPGELSDMFISIAEGTAKECDLLAWIRAHIK